MNERIKFFVNEHIPMIILAVKKHDGSFREVQCLIGLSVSDSSKSYDPSWVMNQSKDWQELKSDAQLAKWIESLEICGKCGQVHGDDHPDKKKSKITVIDTK